MIASFKRVIIFITLVFVASGCVQVPRRASPSLPYEKAASPSAQAGDLAGEPQGEPDSISLPALAEKELDGNSLTLGKVLAGNSAYTRYYSTYNSGRFKISGIMNVPTGKGPFPVLILNHGHIDTAVYTNGRGLKREQDYLARRGYVVLHPDYRNHADSDKDPDDEYSLRFSYTEDVINAVLAVKNSGFSFVDPERIGMLGHSMGGGIAQNVMVDKPDLVKAFVLFAPVSSQYRDNFEKWVQRRAEIADVIIREHGTPESNPSFWDNVSPINFLDRVVAPVQIHHGTADQSVPLAWSQKLDDALERTGAEHQLYVYYGEPHEFINRK